MRVGIGAVLGRTGGPARYACELVRALAALEGDDEYVVFTNRPEAFPRRGAVRVVAVRLPPPATAWEPLWDHVLLPAAARRARLDVYHGTKGAISLFLRCRQVVSIHDLAVYAQPGTFAWLQHLHMRPNLRLAVARADRILADSQHARADIVLRLRVAEQRVVAVPLGVRLDLFAPDPTAADTAVAERLDLPARYFLYAGTIQPRKNVGLVVSAFVRLLLGPEWGLVIAGRRRPGYRPRWLVSPPPGVRYLGVLSDEELAVLYRHAVAMVSPSGYEGFGLTLLEAMASGCPVVGAAFSAVPEVVGNAGLLLDVLDVDAIAAAMARFVEEPGLRAELGRRGSERARLFSWDETAYWTRKVYREVRSGS